MCFQLNQKSLLAFCKQYLKFQTKGKTRNFNIDNNNTRPRPLDSFFFNLVLMRMLAKLMSHVKLLGLQNEMAKSLDEFGGELEDSVQENL